MRKAIGTIVLAIVVVLAIGGAFFYTRDSREQRHREEIRKFEEIVSRLKAERRVAQVVVKEQATDRDGRVCRKIEFLEWDRPGKALPPVIADVVGSEVYFEALVIKFDDQYVEQGDALRGSSIILFRRIFGSSQAPESGMPVDSLAEDGIPRVYRIDANPPDFEVDLWKRFWHYADHPDESAELGVRVMQCEAVGGRLQPGIVYELSAEADGGLNLVPAKPETKKK